MRMRKAKGEQSVHIFTSEGGESPKQGPKNRVDD